MPPTSDRKKLGLLAAAADGLLLAPVAQSTPDRGRRPVAEVCLGGGVVVGEVQIADVVSRVEACSPGALFCCIPGSRFDGHDLVEEAEGRGAAALLVERELDSTIPQILVAPGRARQAMAAVASEFFDHPSRKLKMVGVTGTNGKTTVVSMLASIFEQGHWSVATLGTLSGSLTTPESTDLQRWLATELARGTAAIAMEASSHGIVSHRVDCIDFDVAIFTNLGHDHLDFHGSQESYFDAKAALFDPSRSKVGVVNVGDSWGRRLASESLIPIRGYCVDDAKNLRLDGGYATFELLGEEVTLRVAGMMNVENALGAAIAASELGVEPAAIAQGLCALEGVPGRFQEIDAGQAFHVVVDFAHTPDALSSALETARSVAAGGRVILVFGCGGERDSSKRPLMGAIGSKMADEVWLTSDNPRGEDPAEIVDQIHAGIPASGQHAAANVELDRREAIGLALGRAAPGDVVLIAGKGHELGQIIGGQSLPFDDRQVVMESLVSLREPRKGGAEA